MAEITEAEARRICKAVGLGPDDLAPVYSKFGRYLGGKEYWRIVQRAAAGGDNDA